MSLEGFCASGVFYVASPSFSTRNFSQSHAYITFDTSLPSFRRPDPTSSRAFCPGMSTRTPSARSRPRTLAFLLIRKRVAYPAALLRLVYNRLWGMRSLIQSITLPNERTSQLCCGVRSFDTDNLNRNSSPTSPPFRGAGWEELTLTFHR